LAQANSPLHCVGITQNLGKVAVLMGGTSEEREISLDSGKNVLSALKRQHINAVGIDVGKDVVKKLEKEKPDRVFIALHGSGGEDGVIQGLLDILNIPYATTGVAASALTMHKHHCNLFLQSLELPVIPLMVMTDANDLAKCEFDLPICVKPAASGSSCGVTKVTKLEQLPKAYELAHKYDKNVVIQPWIEGRELTVPILGNEALPVIEITTPEGEFYDYDAKYFKDTTGFICPCDLTTEQEQEIKDLAWQAFQYTGCKNLARVDFILDNAGKFWLLEINTIPGLTKHSLVPRAAKEAGIDFDELVLRILTFTL